MLLRVRTKSGSEYLFDEENMTYTRTNYDDYRGEQIVGKLRVFPTVVVGKRMIIEIVSDTEADNYFERDYVNTLLSTQVLSAEVV